MSATADHAEERTNPAMRLGFEPGQVVQEIGYDDDVDQDLREGIESLIGQDLVDEDYDDVADVVLLWFRDEDGDLTDALVDAIGLLEDGGAIWLLTPEDRPGRIRRAQRHQRRRADRRPVADQERQRRQGLVGHPPEVRQALIPPHAPQGPLRQPPRGGPVRRRGA